MILKIYEKKGEKPKRIYGGDFAFFIKDGVIKVKTWIESETFKCSHFDENVGGSICFAYEE